MISREEASSAFDGARSALEDESHLQWVRSSALLERAYFLGLWSGLRTIANEDDVSGMFNHSLVQTMFSRSADDTFRGTRVGEAYSAFSDRARERLGKMLSEHEQGEDHATSGLTKKDFNELLHLVEELRKYLNQTIKDIDTLIVDVERSTDCIANGDGEAIRAQMQMIEGLEEPLRVVALLETDHLLSKRVGA